MIKFNQTPTSWHLLPSFSVYLGTCEDCGEIGAVFITVGFLIWSCHIVYELPRDHGHE